MYCTVCKCNVEGLYCTDDVLQMYVLYCMYCTVL